MKSRINSILLMAAIAQLGLADHAQSQAVEPAAQPAAERLSGLSYPMTTAPSSLLQDPAALTDLSLAFERDLALIAGQDDIDPATRRSVLHQSINAALARESWTEALGYIQTLRATSATSGARQTSALLAEIVARAELTNRPVPDILQETLDRLLWSEAGEVIRDITLQLEQESTGGQKAFVRRVMDPDAAANSQLTRSIVNGLMLRRWQIAHLLPQKDAALEVLYRYLDANSSVLEDIWPARSQALGPDSRLTPIIMAVWDSGIDAAVYGDRVWRNPAEIIDGVDNDGNGFIDDLHGIAFDSSFRPDISLLSPLGTRTVDEAELARLSQAYEGMGLGLPTPENRAFVRNWSVMPPEQTQSLLDDMQAYFEYSHGTHVGGIMIEGNPAAQLMGIRYSFGDVTPEDEAFTEEVATNFIDSVARSFSYFREHTVRIVNMSWGYTLNDIERSLRSIEPDRQRREDRARAIHQTMRQAMLAAINASPEILFVVAPGNAGEDVVTSQVFPGGFDLPNVMVVGAVDRSGQMSDYSNTGSNIRVHAPGDYVVSKIPGGQIYYSTGTSQAAPYVASLAGKILALEPSLSSNEVRQLIESGCEVLSEDGPCLVNQKRSLAMLANRHGAGQ